MVNDCGNYTVEIIYKNRALECINQKTFLLEDYCQDQKLNLMHVISDIENAFYNLQNNQTKENWSPDALEAFQKIRHKLLDTANNVERLPKNLCYKGKNINSSNSGACIAGIINALTSEDNN